MADLRISELVALAGANLAAGDLLPIVDVSASETKKITVTDLVGNATTLIADATIPGAKILFSSGQIAGSSLASGSVTATQLSSGAVTAAKLGDESTVDLVTTLPATGAFIGQLALDIGTLKIYCWNGSVWHTIKASGSVNSIAGSTDGVVNVVVTASGDSITINTTLDNTSAAGQFLGGPSSGAGSAGYRNLVGTDLPTATTSAKGGVIVNGNGLAMEGDTIKINNSVTASGATYSVVTYSDRGLVTAGRAITSSDLPTATSGAIGAVKPGNGLAMGTAGALNHTNSIVAGTATKITYDSQGHITGSSALLDTDIPNLPATKLTTGTINTNILGANSITGSKLANASTVKFGGAGSTSGVVTFPSPEFQGQYFFDALNGDLYLYDGSAWQPITITAGELIYAGTYDASVNKIKSLTAAGTAAGLVVGAALPAASNSNLRYYVVVSDSGSGTAPAPATALAPPDMIVSNGAQWDLIDVSNAIGGQLASNIAFTPYGGVAATNVQTAIQELDDEKLRKDGGTVTGELVIGTTGALVFEGSTNDAYETYLAVVDPTADRTITFPNASGTVVLSGAIVNADIASGAAIADSKLATISTAGKVSNSATTATDANTASAIVARDASGNFTAGTITAINFSGSGASLTSLTAANLSGTIPSNVLGNSNHFIGTTSIALNRASANQSLTGISSIALPGSTSGTVTITPAAISGTTSITVPGTSGTLITTGDTGTVSNTMLATISTAGKVSNSATTATNLNTVSAIVARDSSGNFSAGTITAALTGNSSTATALSSSRTFALTGSVTGSVSSDLTSGASISTSIAASAITNTEVAAAAAIAGTKISPDFGSQNITTTGSSSDGAGNLRSIPQSAKTSAYILAASDNGKHISITTGGITVNSGIFTAGQVVSIYNNSASSQTITQGTSVTLRYGGTATTGNRTLAQRGLATILCVASNEFVVTGSGVS
jgi:hypothetical protein